ncbi:OmpA family protein [Pseudoduganella sp. R-43]|uniref:OmpA family protein n=1 Tax=Pseudoduganella sp. R-43 TaxID=3404063 RepID=UPI003CF88BFC
MRKIENHIPAICSIALLAACSTPQQLAASKEVAQEIQVPPERVICGPMPLPDTDIDELDIPGGSLAERSVHFDFDSYIVGEDGKQVARNHAAYLVKNKRTVLIQGNTDERGGSEYNLALGQKRAEAVRKTMAALGVPEGRMEAVSQGEEQPAAEGHDEQAWSKNRRADIVYKAR